jgi:hypothetical protein
MGLHFQEISYEEPEDIIFVDKDPQKVLDTLKEWLKTADIRRIYIIQMFCGALYWEIHVQYAKLVK